jgi:pimeloyl-ACP methyl ester carboxylesterase
MWRTLPHYTLSDVACIKARTLVIAGESDVIKREHTDQLAKAIPNSREAIIAGATHAAQHDQPDVVNALILQFLGPVELEG